MKQIPPFNNKHEDNDILICSVGEYELLCSALTITYRALYNIENDTNRYLDVNPQAMEPTAYYNLGLRSGHRNCGTIAEDALTSIRVEASKRPNVPMLQSRMCPMCGKLPVWSEVETSPGDKEPDKSNVAFACRECKHTWTEPLQDTEE